MANKIHLLENPPDATGGRYVVLKNTSGQAWNGSAYATYTNVRDTWDVQATHIGAGLWQVTVPPSLPVGYTEWEWYREASTGVRSDADDLRRAVGGDNWDGTNLAYGSGATASEIAVAVEAQLNTRLLTALAMARLERSVGTIVTGTVGTLATTTSIPLSSVDPAPGVPDQFRGRILLFQHTASSGVRAQGARIVGNTTGSTPVLTVTALVTPPAPGELVAIT